MVDKIGHPFAVNDVWLVPQGIRAGSRTIIAVTDSNIRYTRDSSSAGKVQSVSISTMLQWVESNHAYRQNSTVIEGNTDISDAAVSDNSEKEIPMDDRSPRALIEQLNARTPKEELAELPINNPSVANVAAQPIAIKAQFFPLQKTMLFIDSRALFLIQSKLGFFTDFIKLKNYIEQRTYLVRSYFYSHFSKDDTNHQLISWLNYNSYTVRQPIVYHDDQRFASAAIALTLDLLEQANHIGHILILASNALYVPVIQRVKELGVMVTVLASVDNECRVSDELRRAADQFIDLKNIMAEIRREHHQPR